MKGNLLVLFCLIACTATLRINHQLDHQLTKGQTNSRHLAGIAPVATSTVKATNVSAKGLKAP
jgi:hypothetical protein